MDQELIRKIILKALVSNDLLFNELVLKGGNALSLIYRIGNRSSLDLDFSIEDDFKNLNLIKELINVSLTNTFKDFELKVFDFSFERKPQITNDPWWGGYRIEFKLINEKIAEELYFNINEMSRRALTVDPGSQKRKYTIEISKFEYISEKVAQKIDEVDIYVYPPLLLAIEKLRAILQQHNEYPQISQNTKRSRARDFYDIWVICDFFAIKLDMHLALIKSVFSAKKVDMNLLNKMTDVKDLHYASWADVEVSVSEQLEDFDFYFNFINTEAKSLYAQWIKNSP